MLVSEWTPKWTQFVVMQADAMRDVSGQKQFRRPMLVVTACLVLSAMPAKAAGDAARGEPLYQRYCSGCHGVDGHGGAKNFMPHVGALTKKGYIDLLEDEYLATVIAEGGEAIGKSGFMPSWKTTLSKQDIADVIAYIRTFTLY